MLNKKALAATAAAEPLYVEDVFSTYLYAGTGSAQTFTNGIDLSTEGGLVWIKARSGTESVDNHIWTDTVRGNTKNIYSNLDIGQTTNTIRVTAFNTDGFSIGTEGSVNNSTTNYASWSFRKAKKFFDIVTYTATSTGSVTLSHNLGSTPGMIVRKITSDTGDWFVWHRSLSSGNLLYLNLNLIEDSSSQITNPTSTQFTTSLVSGQTYVFYLFAHDAGGFGDSGNDSVISCGSYTGNGLQAGPSINLGWEPQLVIIKRATGAAADWLMHDNIRGIPDTAYYQLRPNTNEAEASAITTNSLIKLSATGFQINSTGTNYNANGSTYIYIAIRRGPMKTPEAGTEVFSPNVQNASSTAVITTNFPIDMVMAANRSRGFNETIVSDRLRGTDNVASGGKRVSTNTTNNEESDYGQAIDRMTGFIDTFFNTAQGLTSSTIYWSFKRAPGFFDIVTYAGNGTGSRAITHNLGVTPELVIVKQRTGGTAHQWWVLSTSGPKLNVLNSNSAADASGVPANLFGDSTYNNYIAPTSTTVTLSPSDEVNASTYSYVMYLFASVAGVSKVGSYTGNGSSQTINCGFTGGARFVLIKRTDSTGDWVVFDSARGIVSGNDPYLELNTTNAEVTNKDAVDTDNTGFVVNETTGPNINTNSATYIYLAIA